MNRLKQETSPLLFDFLLTAFLKIKRPDNVPATLQNRAYTSPIWYTP